MIQAALEMIFRRRRVKYLEGQVKSLTATVNDRDYLITQLKDRLAKRTESMVKARVDLEYARDGIKKLFKATDPIEKEHAAWDEFFTNAPKQRTPIEEQLKFPDGNGNPDGEWV